MSGFRKFLLRGNVVDLAVAVLIGASFGAVITAFTRDFITPRAGRRAGSGGQVSGSELPGRCPQAHNRLR